MDSEIFSSDTGTETDNWSSEAENSALICELEPDSLARLVRTAVGLPTDALDRLAGVADKLRAVEGLPLQDSTAD